MLQRVFAGANAAEEYSAAHNAALSLARIYGHVTDRASIEVIRRPSRDPDAPSETALRLGLRAFPLFSGLADTGHLAPADMAPMASNLALSGPPAAPLGSPEPSGPEPRMHV